LQGKVIELPFGHNQVFVFDVVGAIQNRLRTGNLKVLRLSFKLSELYAA